MAHCAFAPPAVRAVGIVGARPVRAGRRGAAHRRLPRRIPSRVISLRLQPQQLGHLLHDQPRTLRSASSGRHMAPRSRCLDGRRYTDYPHRSSGRVQPHPPQRHRLPRSRARFCRFPPLYLPALPRSSARPLQPLHGVEHHLVELLFARPTPSWTCVGASGFFRAALAPSPRFCGAGLLAGSGLMEHFVGTR